MNHAINEESISDDINEKMNNELLQSKTINISNNTKSTEIDSEEEKNLSKQSNKNHLINNQFESNPINSSNNFKSTGKEEENNLSKQSNINHLIGVPTANSLSPGNMTMLPSGMV